MHTQTSGKTFNYTQHMPGKRARALELTPSWNIMRPS